MDASFNLTTDSDWSWLFHGEEIDQEIEGYNYGYRFYIPQLGRWLSRDPIGTTALEIKRFAHLP